MNVALTVFARLRPALGAAIGLVVSLGLGLGADPAAAKTAAPQHSRARAGAACAKVHRGRHAKQVACRTATRKKRRAPAKKRSTRTSPKAHKPAPTAAKTKPIATAKPTITSATTTTTPLAPPTISPTSTLTGAAPMPQIFAPTSVWNQPLAPDAPTDPQSATYVSNLLSQISAYGLWMNTYQYSAPIFTVSADQPTVPVKLDSGPSPQATALQQSWNQGVPIPSNAVPAAGSDAHMVIYQPSTDRMWEFWNMIKKSDGWHASWGGTMSNVSTNPGYFTSPGPSSWGATATSLPLLGGLIRPDELAAGQIDHAIALAVPHARAQYFTWPAQRTDGQTYSTTAIPEGQRFRLDPNLDLSTIPMSPLVRMIAVAAQKYGLILRDQSGAVTLYGEDTTAEGLPNPYYGATGWFEGQYVSNLLKAFPWSHLEALQDKMSCCWQNPY